MQWYTRSRFLMNNSSGVTVYSTSTVVVFQTILPFTALAWLLHAICFVILSSDLLITLRLIWMEL